MKHDLILGADVGGTTTKFVVGTEDEPPMHAGNVETDPQDAAATFARLSRRVADLLPDGSRIVALGAACAGIVDVDRAVLGRAPNLPGWEGCDLGAAVREAFGGMPAVFANDVNAALVGEARFGAGRGHRDMIMMALGTGVGGGVMVAGHLITGARSGAGEIGHMVLDPEGPFCGCGNRGCLEAYAGSLGLLAAARGAIASSAATPELRRLVETRGEELETRELAELAAAGDASATSIFNSAGRMLGIAVGNLVNILDPDLVIIGGGVAQAGDIILGPCRETASSLILCTESRNTPVVVAELGTLAAALGAARLARDALEGG